MNMISGMQTSKGDILIVEDSQTQAEKLCYLIEQKGYQTRIAKNGKLALAEIDKSKPCLILSDIVMPEMNGYQLCQTVKSNPAWNDIAIILLTSLNDAKDVISGLKCGADNFIRKPYDENYLLARIEYLFATREMRKTKSIEVGIAISLDGQQHFINAERQQILDLLISTYEQAILVNNELKIREQRIVDLNAKLAQRAIELEEINRELDRKNIELEAANKAKSLFFASMSHELRTPLSAIIGYAELLRYNMAGNLAEDQIGFVRSIFDSGEHLLSLVNDILDLSKIESGKMELSLVPTNVDSTLKNILFILKERAHSKNILVSLDCLLEKDMHLDDRKFKQIIFNLLSNAIKFTPERGRIDVSAKLINQSGFLSNNVINAVLSHPLFEQYLELKITDTGIGINESDLNLLFNPFVQLGSDTSRHQAGTGLGLVITKQLAELHGGQVTLTSSIGRGSTFTVCLPYRAIE
jgi:signal transduction histidine kinase